MLIHAYFMEEPPGVSTPASRARLLYFSNMSQAPGFPRKARQLGLWWLFKVVQGKTETSEKTRPELGCTYNSPSTL